MPETQYPFSKPTLAYAKLVATPTDTSWSQVYNAGNLFACISLTVKDAKSAEAEEESTAREEEISLPRIGKEILDTLHSEFFVLDKKTIPSISDVISKSIQHVPDAVSVDVSLGFFKDNILYLFLVGRGRVIMKRQGKIGKLLENNRAHKEIMTASGYLHNEDTVVLETNQFAADITDATLASALELELPNDIAEALSPALHEKADGGQAAIIVVYHGVSGSASHEDIAGPAPMLHETLPEEDTQIHQKDEPNHDNDHEYEEEEEEVDEPRKKFSLPSLAIVSNVRERISAVRMPEGLKLSHTRKLFLSITIILILLLVGSIFFTKKKQADEQRQQQFQAVYEPAQKKYEDGKALEILNKDVSNQNYIEAKQLLAANAANFPAGSEEANKIQDLLKQIDSELADSGSSQSANAKEAEVPANSLLAVEKANKEGKGFTQDENNVYFVTDKAIFSVSKSSGSKSEIIKNNNTWGDAVGIAAYFGNLYVLDRDKGIIKFAAGGYGQSSYFKDNPSMTSAKDLAIDSSIWVLMQDGTVQKYTSGAAEGYKTPKLEKSMNNPAKIFTDANTSNLYILDRGNSRVVRIAKEDSSNSSYSSQIIQSARDFEVKEKEKKILILSGDKTYEIAL